MQTDMNLPTLGPDELLSDEELKVLQQIRGFLMYSPAQPDTASVNEEASLATLGVPGETPRDIIQCLAQPASDAEKDSRSSSERQSAGLLDLHLALAEQVHQLSLLVSALASNQSLMLAAIQQLQQEWVEDEEDPIPSSMSRKQ